VNGDFATTIERPGGERCPDNAPECRRARGRGLARDVSQGLDDLERFDAAGRPALDLELNAQQRASQD
jgi:hypothetical protein